MWQMRNTKIEDNDVQLKNKDNDVYIKVPLRGWWFHEQKYETGSEVDVRVLF